MRFGWCIILLLSCYVGSQEILSYLKNGETMVRVKQQYGELGKQRIKQWLNLINNTSQQSEWRKVHIVNNFLNQQIKYISDHQLWQKNDYWATPIETLAIGMGDCEDYVITKYFTLIALGIPEHKIRFMYVRQRTINQPHMVLLYFDKPHQTPYVLDNFNPLLVPADQREDLTPIYSFNGQGLWLAKSKGLGNKVKNGPNLSAWDTMLKRIEQGVLSPTGSNNTGAASNVSRF